MPLQTLFGGFVPRSTRALREYIPHKRNPLNVPGPFYVEKDECIACGAPEMEAEGLMSHGEDSQCFFILQPSTPEQADATIRAVGASCCGAVRYGGDDPEILARLANLGSEDACDHRPAIPFIRMRPITARFEYVPSNATASLQSAHPLLEELITLFTGKESKAIDVNASENKGSFRNLWPLSFKAADQSSIRISILRTQQNWWLLRISENEIAEMWTAISLDKGLRKNPSISSLTWLTDREVAAGSESGRDHPY